MQVALALGTLASAQWALDFHTLDDLHATPCNYPQTPSPPKPPTAC